MKNKIAFAITLLVSTITTLSNATCLYEDVVDSCLANVSNAGIDSWRCEADVASCYMNVIVGEEQYECGYAFYYACGTVGGYICGWYDLVGPMITELVGCNVREDRPDIDPVNPDPPPPVTIVTESIPAPSDCLYEDVMEACLQATVGSQIDQWRCEADMVDCYINVVLGDTNYSCGYGWNNGCGTVGGYICGWYDVTSTMTNSLPYCTPQDNRPDL